MRKQEIINDVEESRCSYTVSKLLQSKGFYIKKSKNFIDQYGGNGKGIGGAVVTDLVPQPTHALAREWIRVNFGFCINLHPRSWDVDVIKWSASIDDLKNWRLGYGIGDDRQDDPYDSPKEVIEAALEFILNKLI